MAAAFVTQSKNAPNALVQFGPLGDLGYLHFLGPPDTGPNERVNLLPEFNTWTNDRPEVTPTFAIRSKTIPNSLVQYERIYGG